MPAMLRFGLIENVRRMALRTVQRLDEVEEADRWAARLRAAHDADRSALGSALDAFIRGHPPLSSTFVSRFLHQIRLGDGAFTPLAWLEQWLAEDGLSAEEAAARATQRVALTQVMMANSITSLRAIARMDWRSFVERQSRTEGALRADPSGDYARMTFATRDQYRHVVERIAKAAGLAEDAVAPRRLRTPAPRGRPTSVARTSATTSSPKGGSSWRSGRGTGRPSRSVCIAGCCTTPT
jgi:cyclic beta-1,2-glucan synthetase